MEEQMTVISTGNISKTDIGWLIDRSKEAEGSNTNVVVFEVGDNSGFLIPINEEMLKERETFPASFENAVVYAMAKGSDWLMIDPIAKEAALLRSFDW